MRSALVNLTTRGTVRGGPDSEKLQSKNDLGHLLSPPEQKEGPSRKDVRSGSRNARARCRRLLTAGWHDQDKTREIGSTFASSPNGPWS
jgi:hypothetical protein